MLRDTFIVGNSTELPPSRLCLQLKCKESFGQSPSALTLFLLSAFVLPSYSFNLLSVGQGVDTFNPETFAGREYYSRKEQNPVNYGM